MRKIIITLILTLPLLFLFSGCSAMNKSPETTSQGQPDSAKLPQATSPNKNVTTKDTSSNSPSTNDKLLPTDTNLTTTDTSPSTSLVDTHNTVMAASAKNTKTAAAPKGIKLTKKDIQAYSVMTKTALIKALGKNYKLQGTTLVFSNGLSFYGLNKSSSKPTIIKLNNNVELMGIKNGMTFKKVQSILGKTSVIKTYIGTKANKVYKIQYKYGKDVVKVISPETDGKNSFIEINVQ